MGFRVDERGTDFREIDRFDGGVGWIAHPDETMQRASHALAVDGDVWVFDPVDAEGLDDLLAEVGEVTGVVVGLGRHSRDAAAIAGRHEVPVYLPDWFEGVSEDLDAPVVRFGREIGESGLEAYPVKRSRFWQEVAIYDPSGGTLFVSESVGAASYFLAGDERLGVHPMLRAIPPRDELGDFAPDRILVGHGSGATTDATRALRAALDGSRRAMPRLYAQNLRMLAPF